MDGYVLPHSIEAEKAVLSALLSMQEAFDSISDTFTPDVFYNDKHKIIATAISNCHSKKKAIDIITVCEELKSANQLDFVGGAYAVTVITNQPCWHIESYYKIIFDKYLSRKAILIAQDTMNKAYSGELNGEETIANMESGLDEVKKSIHTQATPDTRTIVANTLASIRAAKTNHGKLGPSTGLRDLDAVLKGLRTKRVYVIAGRPAMGKTAIVLCIAKALCIDQSIPVGVFSLEMGAEELMLRLLSDMSDIGNNILATGNLTEYQDSRLMLVQNKITNNFVIDDTPSITIQYLESKIRKLVQKGVKYIIIDYLQLMELTEKDRKGKNREQEIAHITKNLKRIAKKYDIGIIELSQLSRTCEDRTPPRPMLSDLRESGAIEQDADVVMFLYRPEYYNIEFSGSGKSTKGLAEIIVAKHRGGPVDSAVVRFKGELTRFEDTEEQKPDTMADTLPGATQSVMF